MRKKPIIILISLCIGTLAVLQFISANNDHQECSQSIVQERTADGTIVTAKQHICKERFPF